MAGHSKWKNIQGRKNAQDAKRGKVFQKLSREIFIAAKNGGDDIASNPSLRLVVDKARAANMPNDNVERAIKKATSSTEGANYDEVTYEGYGPGGVADVAGPVRSALSRADKGPRAQATGPVTSP